MKKLTLSLCLFVSPLVSYAAEHTSPSFLNVTSLQVSNVAAISNHVMFTMTNIVGTAWTNLQGTLNVVTNIAGAPGSSSNSFMLTSLLKDVTLFADTMGRVPVQQITATSGNLTNFLNISPLTLSGKLLCGAGANSAVTFVFTPIWKNPSKQVGQPYVATTHDWSVAVTAVASSTVTFATNAPLYLWPGAYGLRLRSVVNSDTDYTGNVWIQELDLDGFRP